LVIISVDFDVIDQLLVRYSAFVTYWRKMGVWWGSTWLIYRFKQSLWLSQEI